MKVNTDGVLLGAWVDISTASSVLDIGTGTGVIALMMAQRNKTAKVDGVELHEGSYTDASANADQSQFSDRVSIAHTSIQEYAKIATKRYDHIVSNPPYFKDGTVSPDKVKASTRHTLGLSFSDLIASSLSLLNSGGELSVILPNVEGEVFISEVQRQGLFLSRKCNVFVKEGVLGRYLMTFSRVKEEFTLEEITIRLKNGSYSEEYKELTREFYLAF